MSLYSNSLFVGDLPKFCSEVDLEQCFAPFGPLLDVKIKRNNNTGKTLSYGFVTFPTLEAADEARVRMDGYMLGGRKLRVRWAAYNARSPPSGNESVINSVYVRFVTSKLDQLITEVDLHHVFDRYGCVEDVSIKESSVDQRSGRQCGYGFVHFRADNDGIEAAFQAVSQIDNATVDGVTYNVELSRNLLKQFSQRQQQLQAQQLSSQSQSMPSSLNSSPPHPHNVSSSELIRRASSSSVSSIGSQIGGGPPSRGGSWSEYSNTPYQSRAPPIMGLGQRGMGMGSPASTSPLPSGGMMINAPSSGGLTITHPGAPHMNGAAPSPLQSRAYSSSNLTPDLRYGYPSHRGSTASPGIPPSPVHSFVSRRKDELELPVGIPHVGSLSRHNSSVSSGSANSSSNSLCNYSSVTGSGYRGSLQTRSGSDYSHSSITPRSFSYDGVITVPASNYSPNTNNNGISPQPSYSSKSGGELGSAGPFLVTAGHGSRPGIAIIPNGTSATNGVVSNNNGSNGSGHWSMLSTASNDSFYYPSRHPYNTPVNSMEMMVNAVNANGSPVFAAGHHSAGGLPPSSNGIARSSPMYGPSSGVPMVNSSRAQQLGSYVDPMIGCALEEHDDDDGRSSDEESEAVQVIQTDRSHYDLFASFNEDATVRHPSTSVSTAALPPNSCTPAPLSVKKMLEMGEALEGLTL
eukprot:gene4248-4668_t